MKPISANGSLAKRRAIVFLVIGAILFSLGPVLIKLMVERNQYYGIFNPGAISFCNVLFIGNLCAGIIILVFHSFTDILKEIINLPRKTKFYLFAITLTSTVYPALIFIALEYTTVINLILISRFNGIVYMTLAYFVLGLRLRKLEILGYLIIGITVITLLVYTNKGFHFSLGDWLILSAAIFFAFNELLSKKLLPGCSIPTYVFSRNFISAIIFFCIAVILLGPGHFMEAFGRNFWILMLLYAGVAIVLAQIFWVKAISVLPLTYVANINLLNPIFSLAFAFLLLQESPHSSEWLAIIIITLSIILPKLSRKPQNQSARPMSTLSIDTSLVGK
ncbi:permeases of drug/transporter [Legionella busanensis]|uniref:Permeases of drug/transporter n=1 Tax=Legionella busanensis TaxID=190655 RepID=A0A378JGY8_9GAMM|nr:DMT family transporter [Legionella busanensis]STX50445.1 permeases of drug/transporter [Legionella busanensis]